MITNPRTQKAKGINELEWNGGEYLDKYVGAMSVDAVVYDTSSLTYDMCKELQYPYFARPCPMFPRHGFVDSLIVNNYKDLFVLACRTFVADKQSEIVLMPVIAATHSAILQEGRLTIGPGHDGATSGRDSVSVYLRGDGHLKEHAICMRAGVKESPYIELVYDSGLKPKAVQLRDGPRLPQSTDNIPADMTVEHVLTVECDEWGVVPSLLNWEKAIKEADRGTVVYHPGGTLSSHYSIHAVVAGIPVLISREPLVGEELKQTKDAEVPRINWPTLKAAFVAGMNDVISMQDAMRLVLAVSKVLKSPDSYVQGYAMGLAYRLSLTACMSECRHLLKRKPDRHKVYKRVWAGADKHRQKIGKMYDLFMNEVWATGYGGVAWASVAHAAYSMYQGIAAENVEDVLFEFNKLVDAHHNNAWFGSKFIKEEEFERASRGYYGMAVRSAKTLYALLKHKRQEHKRSWLPLPALKAVEFGSKARVQQLMFSMGEAA